MSETARYADVVRCPVLAVARGVKRRIISSDHCGAGRVVRIRAGRSSPAGRGAHRHLDPAFAGEPRRLTAAADRFTYADQARRIFAERRRARVAGGTADYAGITWERCRQEMGVFRPMPDRGAAGNAAVLFEDQRSYHPWLASSTCLTA